MFNRWCEKLLVVARQTETLWWRFNCRFIRNLRCISNRKNKKSEKIVKWVCCWDLQVWDPKTSKLHRHLQVKHTQYPSKLQDFFKTPKKSITNKLWRTANRAKRQLSRKHVCNNLWCQLLWWCDLLYILWKRNIVVCVHTFWYKH